MARELVWGLPWRGNVEFPGLAYCLDGKSLYWGGWCPRLTAADLEWHRGLGTTYHESGTLWMGTEPAVSVTDPLGRFHHVSNAYCCDQRSSRRSARSTRCSSA